MADKATNVPNKTEYISRENAAQVVCKACERPICPRLWRDDCDSIDRLSAIPVTDVRPVVRARWEPSEKYKGYASCSNCHDCYIEPEWVERMKWKFCPNCGADMRGNEKKEREG